MPQYADECRNGVCNHQEGCYPIREPSLDPNELKQLNSIVQGLQDVHYSVVVGMRNRSFVLADLEEELERLTNLVDRLKG